VLDTFLSETLKATMGEHSLLYKQGAAHARLKKILHPTLSVSPVCCLLMFLVCAAVRMNASKISAALELFMLKL